MPALADHRVVALREVGDVLVEPRDGRRLLDPRLALVSISFTGGGAPSPPRTDAARRQTGRCGRRPPATPAPHRPPTRRPGPSYPPICASSRRRCCRPSCRRTGTAPAARSRSRRGARRAGWSRTSTPSTNTVPGGGSCSRASRLISVDLPEPVTPDERDGLPGRDARRDAVAGPGTPAVREASDRGTRSRRAAVP